MSEAQEGDDHLDDETCPNCGGEGYVYDCFEEYACVDPESGCDLCMRRCDWCNPPKPKKPDGLTQVLADAPHGCPFSHIIEPGGIAAALAEPSK